MRSYEIDYDEISECTEPLDGHKIKRTAKGNEVSPAKMPLMRIRSVEIVFEDEMSTCTDTGLLDRSMELIVTDSSDDSTKCLDDIEPQIEKDNDSVTLNNADGELSDDNSASLDKDEVIDSPITSAKDAVEPEIPIIKIDDISKTVPDADDISHVQSDVPSADDISSSFIISEMVDSGRYTEEACSSHFENVPTATYDDALLSHTFDLIDVEITSTVPTFFETQCSSNENHSRLFEYIDSNSESSDDTAVCDIDNIQIQNNLTPLSITTPNEDQTVDCSDLQYDSFVDMGKF